MKRSELEPMLRKVQGLLRQADHPNTGPTEAQTFRRKAEALMMKYRIEEAMLAEAPGADIDPEWQTFDVCNSRSEYRYYYRALVDYVSEHVGVRCRIKHERDSASGSYVYRADVVGFEGDLHMWEMLYTSCMLAFQTRLEPGYDPSLSDQINAYNMRKAGMEGWRIAVAIWGERGKSDANLYKARRLFKLEALARGEDPSELLGQGNRMALYRENYANGFVSELRWRLSDMRTAREGSHELLLAGRKERIDEAFYERYPDARPPAPLPPGEGEEEGEEGQEGGVGRNHARGTYVDPRADCEKCQKAKSGYCRDHSYLRPSTARSYRNTYHAAGDRAGRQAARSVDLGSPRGGRSLS